MENAALLSRAFLYSKRGLWGYLKKSSVGIIPSVLLVRRDSDKGNKQVLKGVSIKQNQLTFDKYLQVLQSGTP